jgi:hypothetical protein
VVATVVSERMTSTDLLSDAERGDATLATAWLSGLAIGVAFVAAVINTTWHPVAWVLAILSGGLLTLRVADSARRWMADGDAVRRVPAPALEAVR